MAEFITKKENQRRLDESDRFYNKALQALQEIEGPRVGMMPQKAGSAR